MILISPTQQSFRPQYMNSQMKTFIVKLKYDTDKQPEYQPKSGRHEAGKPHIKNYNKINNLQVKSI